MSELLHRKLLFITHRGLVEVRLLAINGSLDQIQDLADAMENIPSLLLRWNDSHLTGIIRELETYEKKYPQAFKYLQILDWSEIPDDL